jgi:hypothetical protein
LSYIEYVVDFVLILMYIINTYFVLKKVSSLNREDEEKRIRKIVRDYIMSDEFREIIRQAINDSELAKNIEILKLVLCTHINELKNTKICNNGSS